MRDVVRRVRGWAVAVACVASSLVATVLVPAVAWAHSDPAAIAVGDVLARRRSRGMSVLSFIPVLCCLVVIGLIVAIVLLVVRRRGRPGPGGASR